MLRTQTFGKIFGALSVVIGFIGVIGTSLFAIDSAIFPIFAILAFLVYPLLFGWKVYSLSRAIKRNLDLYDPHPPLFPYRRRLTKLVLFLGLLLIGFIILSGAVSAASTSNVSVNSPGSKYYRIGCVVPASEYNTTLPKFEMVVNSFKPQ